jgi:hypothetical protein
MLDTGKTGAECRHGTKDCGNRIVTNILSNQRK